VAVEGHWNVRGARYNCNNFKAKKRGWKFFMPSSGISIFKSN
jgi:hypothetical protein